MRFHDEDKESLAAREEQPVSEPGFLSIYLHINAKHLCHKATPTTIDTTVTPSMEKLSDLTLIERRLDNWFLKQSQTSTQFTGNVKKRWDSLQGDVNDALTTFASLNVAKSTSNIITGEKRLNQKISIKNRLSIKNVLNILNRMRSLKPKSVKYIFHISIFKDFQKFYD